ncbi:hypothetical protein HY450_02070 [Candidatus Pacearchaeota archaeon]|nr:hypothetical protein [Candidatus Pacearchaeota archaeon]
MEDLIVLKERFDVVQLTRQDIADEFMMPQLCLHQRFLDLGYRELEPIVCEYGEDYVSPDRRLVERKDKRNLQILLPAEFVPGSEAAKVLEGDKSRREVYAVYSQD